MCTEKNLSEWYGKEEINFFLMIYWLYTAERWFETLKSEWLLCPFCKSKTRIRVREDTILENFPLFCPKCKHETLIHVRQQKMIVIKEPDAKTQSQSLWFYSRWLALSAFSFLAGVIAAFSAWRRFLRMRFLASGIHPLGNQLRFEQKKASVF